LKNQNQKIYLDWYKISLSSLKILKTLIVIVLIKEFKRRNKFQKLKPS